MKPGTAERSSVWTPLRARWPSVRELTGKLQSGLKGRRPQVLHLTHESALLLPRAEPSALDISAWALGLDRGRGGKPAAILFTPDAAQTLEGGKRVDVSTNSIPTADDDLAQPFVHFASPMAF